MNYTRFISVLPQGRPGRAWAAGVEAWGGRQAGGEGQEGAGPPALGPPLLAHPKWLIMAGRAAGRLAEVRVRVARASAQDRCGAGRRARNKAGSLAHLSHSGPEPPPATAHLAPTTRTPPPRQLTAATPRAHHAMPRAH